MKKIFSIFLMCCTTFVFADNEPVFEETEENAKIGVYSAFAAQDPFFEEEDEVEACHECGDPNHEKNKEERNRLLLRADKAPKCLERDQDQLRASYVSWRRYQANFGLEKLGVRFPQKPAISQSSALLTAYAYDNNVLYSLTGYFPPIGNVNPVMWFEEMLFAMDRYPYNVLSHVIFQVANGDWVMDYIVHDYVQNLILKTRAIVTPFNGYTLQCVKPNGARDHFDYFLDNFYIKCECK